MQVRDDFWLCVYQDRPIRAGKNELVLSIVKDIFEYIIGADTKTWAYSF